MERFLASPYCKIIVLCFVLLLVLGFGYHVAHNLRLARQHSPAPPPYSEIADAPLPSR